MATVFKCHSFEPCTPFSEVVQTVRGSCRRFRHLCKKKSQWHPPKPLWFCRQQQLPGFLAERQICAGKIGWRLTALKTGQPRFQNDFVAIRLAVFFVAKAEDSKTWSSLFLWPLPWQFLAQSSEELENRGYVQQKPGLSHVKELYSINSPFLSGRFPLVGHWPALMAKQVLP